MSAVDGVSGWSPARRSRVLSELDQVMSLVRVAHARVLRAEQVAGTSVGPGDRSFVDARARVSGAGAAEARRQVRAGEVLDAMPVLAGAVADSRVGLAQLDVIAQVTAEGPQGLREALADPAAQARFTEAVTGMTPVQTRKTILEYAAVFDPGRVQDEHDQARRDRFFNLSGHGAGVKVTGFLDATSGHALRLALEAASPRVEGDERTGQQRRADALGTIATHALGCGTGDGGTSEGGAGADGRGGTGSGASVSSAGSGGGGGARTGKPGGGLSGVRNRPHISLIVPAETMVELHRAGLAGETGRIHHARRTDGRGQPQDDTRPAPRGSSGGGVSGVPDVAGETNSLFSDLPGPRTADGELITTRSAAGHLAAGLAGVPAPTLEDGTPVALSELARALCDCDITRIAITADNVPVDLGRTARVYTGAHRRAVTVRDQGCAWNGCETPARFTEIHHIRWWDRDNGETSLENAVMLCDYHHHRVHEHNLTIERHQPPPPRKPGRRRPRIENGDTPPDHPARNPDTPDAAQDGQSDAPGTAHGGQPDAPSAGHGGQPGRPSATDDGSPGTPSAARLETHDTARGGQRDTARTLTGGNINERGAVQDSRPSPTEELLPPLARPRATYTFRRTTDGTIVNEPRRPGAAA
ncbi:HNH endonuclease signature motif containing protein [Cellulomonas sp. HZM]|uniref:HNH endonuclease signature motif containing protein n=1 Tax=Cellulomonas sp. HZM TaxID=1454010 RepID=UPI0012DD1C62|nr:HNH endonuclease signature motif containing protein [Cellulomonas sp. HZM]